MAWWLAYEELYGDMDKEYPIMSKDDVTILGGDETITFTGMSTAIGAADTISFDNSWWEDDGFSVTGNPAGSSQDTLDLRTDGYPGNIESSQKYPSRAPITFGLQPGGLGEDHISLNYGSGGIAATAWNDNKYYADGYDPYPPLVDCTSKPKPDLKGPSPRKYQEDKGIADLKDYVSSTYQGHYTNDNSDVQTLDLIHSVGDAESFCRSNALKYLSRYDKKGQAKRDILKAMHYCLLLYYFSGNTNDEITTRGYETF